MNAATAWAVDRSTAKGTERAVLIALTRRAIGCVTVCNPAEVMQEVKIGARVYYDCLIPLEQLREVQRITRPSDNAKLRTFHFPKFCQDCKSVCDMARKTECGPVDFGKLLSLAPTKDTTECGDKIYEYPPKPVENLSLFPALLSKAEALPFCEDCRGTGWRTTEAGAVPCRHTTARLAGRWAYKQAFNEERFLAVHIGEAIRAIAAPKPYELPVQLKLRISQ